MKAKIKNIFSWIVNGFVIVVILAVALVAMAWMSSLQNIDMSDEEKDAYFKGQYDAMQGDVRVKDTTIVDRKGREYNVWIQTESFIDDDDKFIQRKFTAPKK
jgi:hypothetical protein